MRPEILKMNFNFNFIRIASGAGFRQHVRSLPLVICITTKGLPGERSAITAVAEIVARLQVAETTSPPRGIQRNARSAGCHAASPDAASAASRDRQCTPPRNGEPPDGQRAG